MTVFEFLCKLIQSVLITIFLSLDQTRNSPQPYLWVEEMRVHHGAFDVIQVSVVFKGPLKKTGLFAKSGHVGAVVVSEHLVAKDRVSNLYGKK